ncbi:GNAT family N-acetyltransferase [Flavimarina sp. Hel_I_48]|uniref:GNAT family N-acetyltransferase n=1 Tax=Flavimarina sp. Hel_I_48 TaxID=1392488 RepID=UPI0004DF6F8C|nr:GNAT family N-acetyltransferase [Flavimarina sp. Hel_I_48]
MEYRKAQLKDLEPIAKLFNDYRVFYEQPSDLEGSINFLRERLTNSESEIFVCQDTDKQLVGFVQLYPIFSSTRMKKLWLLNDLFVDPSHRGKGISVELIECAKALSKKTNAAGLILETSKSNNIGNKLYPRTGFVLDKEHNYYSWEE